MAAKRKTTTKKDLEQKIEELEAKLAALSSQVSAKPEPKPEAKPAEPKPEPARPKPEAAKPAEPSKPAPKPAPKPAESKPPATFQEALENAYRTAPMSDFHQYRAKVTGYSPAPNRYFVRLTAPVGTVPTSNWNEQKAKTTGYTQPSNQYFATRARLAYHPPDKTFGGFSGRAMSVEGVELKQVEQTAPPPQPKPDATLPKGTQQAPPPPGKSRQEELAEYEADYLKRIEESKAEELKAQKEAEAAAAASAPSTRGTLPKGFSPEPAPAPEKPKQRGTLPKGF